MTGQTINGELWWLYSVAYHVGDRTFEVNIWARSKEEAETHIKSMRETAEYSGQVMALIPA